MEPNSEKPRGLGSLFKGRSEASFSEHVLNSSLFERWIAESRRESEREVKEESSRGGQQIDKEGIFADSVAFRIIKEAEERNLPVVAVFRSFAQKMFPLEAFGGRRETLVALNEIGRIAARCTWLTVNMVTETIILYRAYNLTPKTAERVFLPLWKLNQGIMSSETIQGQITEAEDLLGIARGTLKRTAEKINQDYTEEMKKKGK